jgi:hypothetical protein
MTSRGVVGREQRRWRDLARTGLREGAAVVGVEIPAPAFRSVASIEQDPVPPPHPAVEVLHPQFASAARPLAELRPRTEEMPVGQHGHGDSSLGAHRLDRPRQAPLARLDDDQLLGAGVLEDPG